MAGAIDQYIIVYNIPIAPNITSWSNNKTNDGSIAISANIGEAVKFSATANQPINNWQWYKDGIIQNNNYDNFSTSWSTSGNKVISVNGTNNNGMTNTIIWTINVISSINISSCGNLNQANTVYILNSNVSSGGTCFTIGANNITLEGQGYTINYSRVGNGRGILDDGGWDNIILRNLKITEQNTVVTYSHSIYFKNVDNSRIDNVQLITKGGSSEGIYLDSSNSNIFSNFNIFTSGISAYGIYMYLSNSNDFSNFDIITNGYNGNGMYITSSSNSYSNISIRTSGTSAHGIYINGNSNRFSNISIISNGNGNGVRLNSANSNIVKDGSIIAKANDYYLQNTSTTKFINTNFTTRQIFYYDNKSNFNYENNNILLNTTQVPTASLALTRALINWNQTNISWQEKTSASRTLNYGMSGLLANTNYSIWDDSIIALNLTTDINGNLPIFNMNITISKFIRVIQK